MIFNQLKKEDKKISFVYTTCSSFEEAKTIGLLVVEEKLAVSADYWEIGSIYPWRGVIQETRQYMLLLTTKKELVEDLIRYISDNHSYSTPIIVSCDTNLSNPSYQFWIENTLDSKGEYMTEKEVQAREREKEEGTYHYGQLR